MDPILPSGSPHVTRSEKDSLLKTLRERQPTRKPAGHPSEHEFKPQARPRKAHRGPGPQISRDAISPARARHLERNRLAANKCRLKKKREHEQIQGVLQSETARRDILLAEVDVLREELWRLKNRVFAHANCDDQHISLQLSQMNQDLLNSSSRRSSSSSFEDNLSSGGSEEGAMGMDACTTFPEWGDFSSTLPVYDQDRCGGYFDELLDNFVDVTKM
ncbi:uncharacterized protein N7496_006666 [Penicillium cataractarum]|uniref:BZIP domain-containing protein n=1 Tax=Penicillium cataractarum TaxID=2100454 RepID=A0A9W9S3W9_9EURO|nr:uncharacterized protein N7496_006666 [Penicillium cataractarum]KAJ5370574.1 hypothetical protein N7496_006666 [Penicillium cataractarum]